jgi:hypothetical protein
MARQKLLQAVECCRNDAIGALERVFDASGLSRARRLDARRHLLSPSHWVLMLEALQHRYGMISQEEGSDGLLADQMAATLLSLIRQNFQTTRDHIAYLMKLGLLERRSGRALRVALPDSAGEQFDRALAEAAMELPRIAHQLPEADPERTAISRAPTQPADLRIDHILLIQRPGEPDRKVSIGTDPVVIGRAVGSDIVLAAPEVSRAHCRITLAGNRVTATDLNSTNGTLVNGRLITDSTTLVPFSVLQIGPYRLEYQSRGGGDVESTIRAARLPSSATMLRSHRRSSA